MSMFQAPIQIKNLKLHNRLVMPPMATAKSAPDGRVSQPLCDYYAEKSRGGHIGLIITEHSYISPEGQATAGQLSIARDEDVDGLRALVTAVHQNNTPVFAQINHAGAAAKREITGAAALSASAVRLPVQTEADPLPEVMTLADIEKVTADFAAAARRAKEAGYDGVEIHSAHGYLLNQFYSPLTNRRTDAYTGGTLEGRIRLHLEVIAAVRAAVGEDYPVALRLGACDYMEGGTTIGDSAVACQAFERAGVDLLDLSGGLCRYTRPGVTDQGYFAELSAAVKPCVSVPVIVTGGIVDAAAAESLLAAGKADLIGVGRAIAKDSDWAKNAMQRA